MDNAFFNSKSFTTKYPGRVNQLITHCKICKSFDPATHKGPEPELKTFTALWDTGATGTVITKRVAQELGILPSGQTLVHHANGSDIVNTYIVNVMLPNEVGIPVIEVTEGDLNGFDVLIGMNIIQHGDFSISCKNGNTIFTFQLPSTRELDFVKEYNDEMIKAHTPIRVDKKIYPNDPCPCGSGMKYKKCHGK